MAKRKGNYKPGPGRDSFEKLHGSKPVPFKFNMTAEMHHYITTRDVSGAEYLRRLIEQDMEKG